MGDYPSRSASTGAGGPGVTGRHTGSAGNGVSPIPPDDRIGNRPPLGGGGALATKSRFSLETGFRGLSTAAGAMVLVIIVSIAIFRVSKAVLALTSNT